MSATNQTTMECGVEKKRCTLQSAINGTIATDKTHHDVQERKGQPITKPGIPTKRRSHLQKEINNMRQKSHRTQQTYACKHQIVRPSANKPEKGNHRGKHNCNKTRKQKCSLLCSKTELANAQWRKEKENGTNETQTLCRANLGKHEKFHARHAHAASRDAGEGDQHRMSHTEMGASNHANLK